MSRPTLLALLLALATASSERPCSAVRKSLRTESCQAMVPNPSLPRRVAQRMATRTKLHTAAMESSSSTRDLILTRVAPAVGVAIANVMFLSPMPAVLAARASGSLGDLNPVPFVSIFGNCMAWLGYSMTTQDNFLFGANLPGLLMGLFYSISAIRLVDAATGRLCERLMLTYAAVVGLTGYLAAKGVGSSAKDVFGLLANTLLMLYYAAPLSVLVKVITTRSAASLYAPLAACSLVNGVMWTSYGFATRDKYVWFPNGFGAIVSFAQLVLCAVFGRA